MFQNPQVKTASKVQEQKERKALLGLFFFLSAHFLYGFLVHTVGQISPEIPGSRDFPEGDWGLLVPIPHSEGGLLMAPSVFTWIKQLYIKTLQLSSAQWKGKKKATYAHPSVFHTYLYVFKTFLEGTSTSIEQNMFGKCSCG